MASAHGGRKHEEGAENLIPCSKGLWNSSNNLQQLHGHSLHPVLQSVDHTSSTDSDGMQAEPSLGSLNTYVICESNSVQQLQKLNARAHREDAQHDLSITLKSLQSNNLLHDAVDTNANDVSNSVQQLRELNARAHRADAQRDLFGTAKSLQSDNA